MYIFLYSFLVVVSQDSRDLRRVVSSSEEQHQQSVTKVISIAGTDSVGRGGEHNAGNNLTVKFHLDEAGNIQVSAEYLTLFKLNIVCLIN